MTVIVDTRGALDLKEIPMPPGMNILQLDAENYTDWTGDPALRINVLIDDSTIVEKVPGSALNHLTTTIHDRLIERGISLFPYFFFAKPSELAETDEE